MIPPFPVSVAHPCRYLGSEGQETGGGKGGAPTTGRKRRGGGTEERAVVTAPDR